MGLLDYYKQFEGMADEEVSAELRARAEERRRRALARIEALDLSATTWFEFPHPDVVAAMTYAARRGINRQPDPTAIELRREIGQRHGLEPDRVAVGNGASELMAMAAHVLMEPGDELVTPWPSYPQYPLMVRAAGGRAVPVEAEDPVEGVLSALGASTRLVTICNPNDPTGGYVTKRRLRGLLEQLPERVTLLLDEALIDYVDAEPAGAALELLDDFPRLLIFRTFSKAYGLAAMRSGYALGGPGSEDLMARLRPALGLSAMTQAGSLDALRKCGPLVAARRQCVIAERRRIRDALADLPVHAPPSQANFVWLSAPGLTGHELAARLGRSQLVVYPGSEVGAPDHVRAAVQSPGATDRLLQGLRNAL